MLGRGKRNRNLQCPNLISSYVSLRPSGLAVDYVLSQSERDRRGEGGGRVPGIHWKRRLARERRRRRKRGWLPVSEFTVCVHTTWMSPEFEPPCGEFHFALTLLPLLPRFKHSQTILMEYITGIKMSPYFSYFIYYEVS